MSKLETKDIEYGINTGSTNEINIIKDEFFDMVERVLNKKLYY